MNRYWTLFLDGIDVDADDDGRTVVTALPECHRCGTEADNVAEWIGMAAIHRRTEGDGRNTQDRSRGA